MDVRMHRIVLNKRGQEANENDRVGRVLGVRGRRFDASVCTVTLIANTVLLRTTGEADPPGRVYRGQLGRYS